jgi:site-specific DNA-methyltransferase (adenine-specific)
MINNFHSPDILDAISHLSSDSVFTPPRVVNQILDSLPDEIWQDENITFLDPVCKSGVFLREITNRLLEGLEKKNSYS